MGTSVYSGTRRAKRKMDEPKVCRICGREWWPLTGEAADKRDICYRPECELKREAERRARRNARRKKKGSKK
jgi:hypothetical protein